MVSDEAVKAAAKSMADSIGHGMREKCIGHARAALTAAAPYMHGAEREQALEETISLCKDYAEDSQPDSEYRLACNDIIEAIQERRALSSQDHADATASEGAE